jgi:hypothetical protein
LRLFLYATLLDAQRLAARAGQPGLGARLVPAQLHGWRRVALRGGAFPTLRRAPGASVAGAVIDVDAAALGRLQAYEGPAYRLTRVAARTARGETAAFAWIAPAATSRPW